MNFKQEDMGKLVQLFLDPTTHDLAKALGADEVTTVGEIVEVADEYLKIQRRNKTRQVLYSDIKDYKFLQYVKNTGATYPIIRHTGVTYPIIRHRKK